MDPEQIYQEVLQEEQAKGSSSAVAEGRAKAARARAEEGSPHPKEAKWWPGSQPHFEGGGGEAPAEEAAPEAEAAEPEPTPEPEPEPAPEPAAAPEPVAADNEAQEQTPAPQEVAAEAPAAEQVPAQPAPVPAAPAAVAEAEQPAAQRPSGVTHGTTTGTRLRPEDEVTTDAQFEGQKAHYERRKLIDDLVATGVPAVSVSSVSPRSSAPLLSLMYIVIPVLALLFLSSLQSDEAAGGNGEAPPGNGGPAADITVVAQGVAFDTSTLELTAGEETTIEFQNQDAPTAPHNIAIYESEGSSNELFKGEVIDGGSDTTYTVPPIDAGNYYFQCDVHPGMNGDVVVE